MDNVFALKELFRLVTDDNLIGRGIARAVYGSPIMPNVVFKFETGEQSFQNQNEWTTWQAVQFTEFAKWFAPCRWISPCGTVLVMDRTKPATRFPEKMPVFLTDFKRTNYGMLKGQLVAHDYGVHCMLENGMTKRMRKADWWNLED